MPKLDLELTDREYDLLLLMHGYGLAAAGQGNLSNLSLGREMLAVVNKIHTSTTRDFIPYDPDKFPQLVRRRVQ